MSERLNTEQEYIYKLSRRKYTPLYEKDTKQNQNKPMETTKILLVILKRKTHTHSTNKLFDKTQAKSW